MAQQVKAFGQILQFPDGMSEDAMAEAIRSNEHVLNPDYKQPLSDKLNALAKEHLGVDSTDVARAFTSSPSIADQAESSSENTAARQVPGAPVRQSAYNKALLNPQGDVSDTGIESRIANAANEDIKGQADQQELELLRTEAMKPSESGFTQSALNSAGRTIKGAGQIGSDFFDADKDNAITQYGQKLLDSNPLWVNKLEDIKDEPFLAFKEASGNSLPSMGTMVGVSAVGAGIASLAPLTGPAAPIVAAVGTVVQWLGPAAVAALPSYSGIRDAQILKDPKNESDAKSKAIAAIGASAVGAIEVAFGPQQWAIAMLTKEGRAAMARKFASTTIGEAAIKGGLKGALVEGSEEIVQNPIEQLASYEDPTTKKNLLDTAFGGAMGAIGGSFLGTVTGAASQVNVNKLKPVVDAPTLDDAIVAAHDAVSPLRTEDPTLADVEALNPTNKETSNETQTTIDTGQAQAAEILDIVLPDNSSVKAQWKIVDADQLAASMKEDVNQPRDRTRAASDVQIKSIANAPDYRRLSDSPVMDVGAPVVDQDGRIVAGNGRFAGLSQAYEQGTATEYMNQLREDAARKGLSIEGIAKPVLVRQLSEAVDTRKMAIASNSGTTLQMSALEQAKLDAERMNGIENLDVNDLGDIALTPRNLMQLKDSLGTYVGTELGAMVDKGGQLSQEGMRRVRNAMLAKAYGSSTVLEKLVESTDTDMRNVLGALTKSANHIISTKGDVKPLMEAVDTYSQLKATGQPVDNFLAQQDAFSEGLSKDAEGILRFIDTNVRSQKKLTDFFKGNFVEVDTTSDDMFTQEAPKDASITKLEKHLKDNGYNFTVEPTSVRDVDALDSTKKARKELAEKQAKLFKKKVVFIKADGPFRINGVMVPSIADTIFVDIRTDKAFDAIMAHELSHWMDQEKPAVYKELVKSLKTVIINEAEYAKKYGIEGATKSEITKEIVGDLMGDNFTEQSFWQKVAEANPKAFKDIAATIIKWLKGVIVKAKANGMGSEQWVKDATKAQDIIAKAVAQYTEGNDIVVDQQLLDVGLSDTKKAPSSFIYDMQQDSQGVRPGKLTQINDALVKGEYTLKDISANWKDTRNLLRSRYGDNLTLYRADAPASEHTEDTQVVYAGDKSLAAKFATNGRKVVELNVPVNDVIAMYVTPSDYYEFVIKKPVSAEGKPKFNITGDDKSAIDKAKVILNRLIDLHTKLNDTNDIDVFVEFGERAVEAKDSLATMLESGKLNGIGAEGKWLISRNTTSNKPWRVTDFGAKDGQPFSHTEYKTAKQALSDNNLIIDKSKVALFSRAYHGSPHDHNKFDSSKIGTGEGAQAYGYGHYFAESKDVAEYYRKVMVGTASVSQETQELFEKHYPSGTATIGAFKFPTSVSLLSAYAHSTIFPKDRIPADLAEAFDREANAGKLYEVELAPEQDEYLLWDKPLSDQIDKVKSALGEVRRLVESKEGSSGISIKSVRDDVLVGEGLYGALDRALGSQKAASKYLHSLGIRGIKYLDGASRAKGDGAYNYVIFDDKDVSITAKFSRASQGDLFGANDKLVSQEESLKQNSSRPGDLFADSSKPEIKAEQQGPVGNDLLSDSDHHTTKTHGNTIDDFGEKIGGAKKDVWGKYKDRAKASLNEDVIEQPLSKSWPEPDYQALIDSGADSFAVAFAHAARDQIPTKPSKAYRLSRWGDEVEVMRNFAYKVIDGDISPTVIKSKLSDNTALKDVLGRTELYQLVGHSKSLKGIVINMGSYSYYKGETYSPHKIVWTVEKQVKSTAFGNWPSEISSGDTKQEALDGFKEKYDSLEIGKPSNRETTFDIYRYKGNSNWIIGKKVGRNYIDLANFAELSEARAFKTNNHDELVTRLERAKEIPAVRPDTNNPRVGEDMRGGVHVSPQMFSEAFGFRGVEFGNYVENKKRQSDLNEAFDALMDMSAILNIHPKAISLNGELGLAFGARGSGGVDSSKAHYEREKVVINLTKNSGAGSLGHEWWHALDNYFAKAKSEKSGYMTTALDVSLAARGTDYIAKMGVRKEMIQAFGEVVKAINNTSVKARSNILDSKRGKVYWSSGEEMAARSFESYLISKLQDQNASNDYLANITDEKTWEAAEKLGWELEGSYPYPTAGEVPAIRAAFDHFFTVIDSKETDKGIALFSRAPKLYSKLEQAIEAANDKIFSTGPQVKLWLQSNAGKLGIKKDEIYWSSIDNWLDAQGKVSKQQVVEFVRNNGVQVEDVTLGGSIGDKTDAIYSKLSKNSRMYWALDDSFSNGEISKDEFNAKKDELLKDKQALDDELRVVLDRSSLPKHNNDKLTLPGGSDYKELVVTVPTIEPHNAGDTTHFGDTGQGKQIGWLRMDTRDGGLFIEELQSQRAMDYRKFSLNINEYINSKFSDIVTSMTADGVLEVNCE